MSAKVLTYRAAPALLPIIAALIFALLVGIPSSAAAALSVAPVVALSIALALAVRFRRVRAGYVIVSVALVWMTQSGMLPASLLQAHPDFANNALLATATFAILGAGVLAVVVERGLLNLWGAIRLITFVGTALGLLFSAHLWSPAIAGIPVANTPLGDVSWLILGSAIVAAGLALFAFTRHASPLESGFFGVILCLCLLAMAEPLSVHVSLYATTAGLVLVISLVETSYQLAYRDELTGVPGRRALNEELERLGNTYTIAMVDVDHFKKFNDKYGHDVGDDVLRLVAQTMAKVRGGGRAFRYGGEEFTLLFAGKTAETAAPHIERVRQSIEAAEVTLRSKDRPAKKGKAARGKKRSSTSKVSVTVSIGVAQRDDKLRSADTVIVAADKALYKAKKAGRNQVKVA